MSPTALSSAGLMWLVLVQETVRESFRAMDADATRSDEKANPSNVENALWPEKCLAVGSLLLQGSPEYCA